ncbi:MAG: bifunctional DNA-formamidopyrimidine glycosylase/DNA-(apurinic or apyrimidinic site) lyase [Planctomycetota bacterium]
MPELPEVECVRRGLEAVAVGRTVTQAALHRRDIAVAPGDPDGGWSRQRPDAARPEPVRITPPALLAGDRIESVRRHGKQMAVVGASGRVALVHLGMTGLVMHVPERAEPPADHVHAEWLLDNGSRLVFRDPRRFGGVWLLPTLTDLHERWACLGPDALTIRALRLQRALAGSRAPLKAALLDQRRLAGLGNIYADEAAFRARLHPATPAGSLDADQTKRLASAIRHVLKSGLARGGSTLRDYRDPFGDAGTAQLAHRVYGRGGQPCKRCRAELVSDQLAQRTTTWCPACQPSPSVY